MTQATKEEETSIEDLDIVSKQTEHPMNLIVRPFPENPIRSLDEKAINQEVAKEDQIIEVPHIDFILGDPPVI